VTELTHHPDAVAELRALGHYQHARYARSLPRGMITSTDEDPKDMARTIVEWFGLSTEEQTRAGGLAGRIKSIAEFLKDAVDSVKDTDLPSRIAEACPWWVNATGDALAKSAPPVRFISEFLRSATEVRDPDKLAWLACTAAFQRATELAFVSVGQPAGPRFGASWQPSRAALKVPDTLSFKELSLANLSAHPFVRESESLVDQAAQAVGYDDAARRRLLREVRMRFPGELKRVLSHPETRERFMAVADWLRFDDEDARVFDAWATHADYQRRLFEEAPVFGEEPFALADVYTDTECGKLSWGDIVAGPRNRSSSTPFTAPSAAHADGPLDPFDEKNGGRLDLLTTVMELIGDPTFRDAIVVQGPAGSGKSAFTLRLAVELLRNGLTPIRVRLRDMGQAIRNIDEAIPEAVRFSDDAEHSGQFLPRASEMFLDGRLFDQTVAVGDAHICPYVLIFDGWDEVSVSAARGFFEQVDYILGQIRDRFINRPNRAIVRVILTGRPSDAIARSAFLKQSTCVLTIRSLSPDALSAQVQRLVSIRAKRNGIVADLQRFAPILEAYHVGFAGQESVEEERTARTQTLEVLGLPLLAHLAVRLLMEWPGQRVTEVVESRTTLYRLLTDYTCGSGAFGKDVVERRMQPLRLRRLLQQTAAAMTAYGKDSIPYGELEQRLTELVEKSLLDEVRELDRENPISGLVISFFFKGGQRELGAEFTHKSFREYLTAEAVIEALKDYGRTAPPALPERARREYWREFDASDPRYSFTRVLGPLLGAQWIVPEVAAHLKGLIEWELQRARLPEASPLPRTYRTQPLDLSGWQRVRDGLADLWDWWGEGVHLRPQPQMRGRRFDRLGTPYVEELIDWHILQDRSERDYEPWAPRTTTIDAVLGDALCRLAALVHRHVAGTLDARWTFDEDQAGDAPHTPRRCQSWGRIDGEWQLRFKPTGDHPRYFRFYCDRINAAGPRPTDSFPAGVNFAGADLSDVWFYRGSVTGCSFKGADLRRANLFQTFIETTSFVGASLNRAAIHNSVFSVVYFGDSDLREINGTHTEFFACDFQRADLSGARLEFAIFEGCQIAAARFVQANLQGTTGLDDCDGRNEAFGLPVKSAPPEPKSGE
jgi:hypothetical protein